MYRYRAHFRGLNESSGQIGAFRLLQIVNSLLDTSEKTICLHAIGEGTIRGRKPEWLRKSADFTIAGLRSGSTIIDVDAPPLRETAYPQFAQDDLWNRRPSLDDTAIDLVGKAIEDARDSNSTGDFFDSSVLESMRRLVDSLTQQGSTCEITVADSDRISITIDLSLRKILTDRIKKIPPDRRSIISGFVDEIQYHKSRFVMKLDTGLKIPGRLRSESANAELLREVWGTMATVSGIVSFKPDGRPRFIEATAIDSYRAEDEVFAKEPKADGPESIDEMMRRICRERPAKPTDLFNTWPGDEPIEDLLADLD